MILSFLFCSCSVFLLSLLSSFILSFLLGFLIFINYLFISSFFSNLSFLSFFNFSNSFFSKSFLIFRPSPFDFFDIIKSYTLDSSLFLESFLFFKFSLIRKFNFFMQSSPSSCPSKSLSFKFSRLLHTNTLIRNLLFSWTNKGMVFRLLQCILYLFRGKFSIRWRHRVQF